MSQKAPWASPPCHPPTLLQVTIILTSIATCYLFFKIIFVHLFMAVLGLCCFEGLFLVQASVELLSRCGAQASHCGAQPQELWHVGLVAPRHVRSSGVRDQTLVSFIGRQILYRWDTREAPTFAVLELHKSGIIYLCFFCVWLLSLSIDLCSCNLFLHWCIVFVCKNTPQFNKLGTRRLKTWLYELKIIPCVPAL